MNNFTKLEERLDFLERCTRCSQCKFVPIPLSQKNSSICPSIDHGNFHSYSGGGQVIMAAGLLSNEITYSDELIDAISSCTMCGGCDVSCKINFGETVEPLDSLYALRAKIVQDHQSPTAHRKIIENLTNTGNREGKPQERKADWSIPIASQLCTGETSDILLHIGSNLSFNPQKHLSLTRITSTLINAGLNVGYLGTEETSTGAVAFDLGYHQQAKEFATSLHERIISFGAKNLVTFSSTALFAFKSVFPRFGLNFPGIRVIHISELLVELIDSGEISLELHNQKPAKTIAYHDPCKLGRLSESWVPRKPELKQTLKGFYESQDADLLRFGNDGCYASPRRLLSLLGYEIEELERNKASSYCCGAAGGVRESQPEAAQLAAKNRLAEMQPLATKTLISGCDNCASHLSENSDQNLLIMDLLDLIAENLAPKSTAVR